MRTISWWPLSCQDLEAEFPSALDRVLRREPEYEFVTDGSNGVR